MKKFPALFFLGLFLAALLAGCTNTGRLVATGLRVEVTAIERAGDGTLSATWHIANTNVVAYILSHVRNKVYLNGTYLGLAETHDPMGVPANSNAGRTSKLSGGDAAASSTVADAGASGTGNYRIQSQITVLIYGDSVEHAELANSGSVPVTLK